MASARVNQPQDTWDHLAQQFANPPKEFSPAPIWWWSGDPLEISRLRWQMERLIEGGVYNVVILNLAPTSPLYGSDPDQPPFMSEAWWDIFLGVCEDAKALGMRIWFYDQIGFSGANLQGELVRANPAYTGQSLESVTAEGEGVLELICPPAGEPLAAAYILLDEGGKPDGEPVYLPLHDRALQANTPGHKRLRLMYAIQRGFDYYNPQACAALLDTVHGQFERRAEQYFGNVIVGSFQDELPTLLTWGAGFASAFQSMNGYDLRSHLMSLWEGESPQDDQIRIDYHQVRASLAEKAFFRPFYDWHERHGLICGFDQQGPARAGEPVGGVRLYANYLETHRWYGAPGSDHHGEAKIHSSLAHLYDRSRVWIEAFHSSGWGGTLEETFDWLLPWLRAGATLYNPHAVYYSTRGGWWEWAPPSTCWRQPYWRHYPIFSKAVSRLCYLLSQGTHVCDIGVLYPTTTVQSGLTVAGPLPYAARANAVYESLVGRMMFLDTRTGVLDRDRRDFDILDDASIQNGAVVDGSLRIQQECYRVIILPACTAIHPRTAALLSQFAEQGGMLIAGSVLPDNPHLHSLFESDKAIFVQQPEELPTALERLPRHVEAPVPTLHRRVEGQDVLFVPATFPQASYTREGVLYNWLKLDYVFEPERYQREMKIAVRGFRGVPQLWDPSTGERRSLPATQTGDTTEVEIPFDTGPAALIVWSDAEAPQTPRIRPSHVLLELPEIWTCTLEPTLDNRYGDFSKPDFDGSPPIQTWRLFHRVEMNDEDGLEAGWNRDSTHDEAWEPVDTTFGLYGWWLGPCPADDLPQPLAEADSYAFEGWRPAVYSLQRGIYKDPLHQATLGPKGHVPEEFLAFGPVPSNHSVQFRTTFWMPEARKVHLALAAPAAKSVWVNGQALTAANQGYLWLTPVALCTGINTLEWRLTAEHDIDLRAYWALVTDVAAFTRPERMTGLDAPKKDTRLQFAVEAHVPFEPANFTLQVSADSPCRMVVNGKTVGQQGGFDPYTSLARVQLYIVEHVTQGENQITLEVQDVGAPVAVMADGVIQGTNGELLPVMSGADWQVQRDDGRSQPVKLYRQQWLDPAWSHLWRRSHPLPGSMWLEDWPADETVLAIVPDALAGKTRVEWFRWILPPGVTTIDLPLCGEAQLWVDGTEVRIEGNTAHLAYGGGHTAVMRVLPERGCTGGGTFTGPITYTMDEGQIQLGEWAEQGLEAYSGGVRYRTQFSFNEAIGGAIILDLGRVRGTAEAFVNGQPVGIRIGSPYHFDIAAALKTGVNVLEILVLNTLGPYLQAVSPTHYVHPGQTVSGLMGPVRLLMSEKKEV